MVRSQRVTLQDVAERVGLSANTVSRALAGKNQVSESTRETVVAEAKRLGYVPNSHARSLVSGTTMVLGLVITNPSNPFYAALVSAVERQCRTAGYSVLLVVTEESEQDERKAVQQLLRFGVDGVLGVPTQHHTSTWADLLAANVPVVLLSRDIPELDTDFVSIDARQGIAEAMRRMSGTRVGRAWLFEEDLNISTTTARIAGFRNGLAAIDLTEEQSLVIRVATRREQGASLPWRPDDAYRMAVNLITAQNFPDLVITGNDYFSLGIYKALREHGLAVPDDVLVLGYGDHPFAAYLEPGLSSIQLPADDMGIAAVDLLLERIADPERPRQEALLSPTLIERGSTEVPLPDAR